MLFVQMTILNSIIQETILLFNFFYHQITLSLLFLMFSVQFFLSPKHAFCTDNNSLQYNTGHNSDPEMTSLLNLVSIDKDDEDEKIKKLVETSSLIFCNSHTRHDLGRGFGRSRKTPPVSYVCRRCNIPGELSSVYTYQLLANSLFKFVIRSSFPRIAQYRL